MLIRSSFKDYYDFMAGKYGVDPKIVYNRLPEGPLYIPSYKAISPYVFQSWTIYFCGRVYYVYYAWGDWFFGPEVTKININKYPSNISSGMSVLSTMKDWKASWDVKKNRWTRKELKEQGGVTTANEKEGFPVMVGNYPNPRLADFKFNKIIPPETAFVSISNWLSREKNIINLQTDKEKIVSHGFDLKTSFRK